MLKKLYLRSSRICFKIGDIVIENGLFAFPAVKDEYYDDLSKHEVVDLLPAEMAVLVRPLIEFDIDAWTEISGSHDIGTNPEQEVTQDPRLEEATALSDNMLLATMYGDEIPLENERVRIVAYTNQPGIVEVMYHPSGEYLVNQVIVCMEKPNKGVLMQIAPDEDDDDEDTMQDNDFSSKEKVTVGSKTNNDI